MQIIEFLNGKTDFRDLKTHRGCSGYCSGLAAALILFCNCTTPRLTIHAVGNTPVCKTQTPERVLVLWGSAWRENQKEPALRREIAAREIAKFFNSNPCFSHAQILESSREMPALMLTDADALKLATNLQIPVQKVIFVRVEELGPLLMIYLSPILWEGGSEVILRVRVLNVEASRLESDISIHRKDTGPFVLRGTGALEKDLDAALSSVFTQE